MFSFYKKIIRKFDLYDKSIIDDNTYEDLQDIYEFSKDYDYNNEKI